MRWWLRWYLGAVVWFARATGMDPDWDRVEWWIRRGLVVRGAGLDRVVRGAGLDR